MGTENRNVNYPVYEVQECTPGSRMPSPLEKPLPVELKPGVNTILAKALREEQPRAGQCITVTDPKRLTRRTFKVLTAPPMVQ